MGDLAFDAVAVGDPDGEVVLLLHGFPQTRRAGAASGAGPGRGRLPGRRPGPARLLPRGPTGGRRGVRHAAWSATSLGMLDAARHERAHVVGHDWGAAVAWQVAARHPERVRTLTAVSVPHPVAFAEALAADATSSERSHYVRASSRRTPSGAAGRAVTGCARSSAAAEAVDVERLRWQMREPGRLTAALNWYRAMGAPHGGLSANDASDPVRLEPGDLALGREAPRRHRRATSPGRTGSRCWTGVGHWVPEEVPSELRGLLLDHLGWLPWCAAPGARLSGCCGALGRHGTAALGQRPGGAPGDLQRAARQVPVRRPGRRDRGRQPAPTSRRRPRPAGGRPGPTALAAPRPGRPSRRRTGAAGCRFAPASSAPPATAGARARGRRRARARAVRRRAGQRPPGPELARTAAARRGPLAGAAAGPRASSGCSDEPGSSSRPSSRAVRADDRGRDAPVVVPGWNAWQLPRPTPLAVRAPGPRVLLGDLNMPGRAASRVELAGARSRPHLPLPEPRCSSTTPWRSGGCPRCAVWRPPSWTSRISAAGGRAGPGVSEQPGGGPGRGLVPTGDPRTCPGRRGAAGGARVRRHRRRGRLRRRKSCWRPGTASWWSPSTGTRSRAGAGQLVPAAGGGSTPGCCGSTCSSWPRWSAAWAPAAPSPKGPADTAWPKGVRSTAGHA